MKAKFSQNYLSENIEISQIIEDFDAIGTTLYDDRNTIKIFDHKGDVLNIKRFKVPNAVNKIAYKFFRKSKAERSYNYAQELLKREIDTPAPVAYFEEQLPFTFGTSYFVSKHITYDLTYRELVQEPNFKDHEKILRAFTRFTYELHQKGVLFLDHSPGNTLIQLNDGSYKFYLVDLNRMIFKDLTEEDRLKNFSRLSPKKEMVEVMANEYAKLISKPSAEIFEKMWAYTTAFQEQIKRKNRLKQKFRK